PPPAPPPPPAPGPPRFPRPVPAELDDDVPSSLVGDDLPVFPDRWDAKEDSGLPDFVNLDVPDFLK
ncbi:MAG: hypothetical protein FWG11_08385, partial [Promicromonosporaceae bacterium]|nr:hypothetical protein [Promicromonosporaceae bacterium]